MTTDITYASSDALIQSLILHMLPYYTPQADGIINNSAITAFLKTKGKIDVQDGGQEIVCPIVVNKNSNLGWMSHTGSMSATLQDPSRALRYDFKTFAGAGVIVNKLHAAQNKGKAEIVRLAKTLMEQSESTIQNDFSSSFWASTVATDNPNSIPTLITTTPTTGTIGGQSRSTNKAYQNKLYDTTVSDLGSEAGLLALESQILKSAVRPNDKVDFVVMGDSLFASLSSYLDTLRRFQPDSKMGDLGFNTLKVLGATVVSETNETLNGENTITSTYIYGINSKYMKLVVLKDGNFKWSDKFEHIPLTLNDALYFYVFCQLCDQLPRAHFLMSSVTA